jgi:SAM-dependent methyltransferase
VFEEKTRFWEEYWQLVIEKSPLHKRRNGSANPMRRWNRMAADFAERTADARSGRKRLKTIAWLTEQGALTPGSRVLDIGAGPGNWTVLLAQTAAHVTALEPAEAMADLLQQRIEQDGITNVSVDQRTWQAVSLDEEGWTGGFDLVFASMTPGIDGPASLRKMIAASRGHCYLSAFSGRGWQQWYGDLWRNVFNEAPDGHPGDIIHPFNMVYAMGYRPNVQFNFWQRESTLSREKAMEDFLTHLEAYTELTDDIRSTVAGFVDAHCRDGVFSQQRNACQGMMVWNVNEKVPAS